MKRKLTGICLCLGLLAWLDSMFRACYPTGYTTWVMAGGTG